MFCAIGDRHLWHTSWHTQAAAAWGRLLRRAASAARASPSAAGGFGVEGAAARHAHPEPAAMAVMSSGADPPAPTVALAPASAPPSTDAPPLPELAPPL